MQNTATKLAQHKLAALLLVGAFSSALQAGAISPTADPFGSGDNGFGLGGQALVCFPTVCSTNNISRDYVYDSKTFAGDGNEYAQLHATFSGDIYDPTGQNYLGSYSATGYVGFEFIGRSADSTGQWNAIITRDDFTYTALGHTFSLTLDPNQTSTGQLTISLIGGTSQLYGFSSSSPAGYNIVNDYSVHGLFTVDPGLPGGFSNLPSAFGLSEVNTAPEPASLVPFLAPLAVLARKRVKR